MKRWSAAGEIDHAVSLGGGRGEEARDAAAQAQALEAALTAMFGTAFGATENYFASLTAQWQAGRQHGIKRVEQLYLPKQFSSFEVYEPAELPGESSEAQHNCLPLGKLAARLFREVERAKVEVPYGSIEIVIGANGVKSMIFHERIHAGESSSLARHCRG